MTGVFCYFKLCVILDLWCEMKCVCVVCSGVISWDVHGSLPVRWLVVPTGFVLFYYLLRTCMKNS